MTANKLNLTKAAIESLPLPEMGWKYYHDLKTRGLCIGISSTGRKTFTLYRKINGKPERVKIGPYPDLSIEQARDKAAELNSAIAQGANPAEVKRNKRTEMTFKDMFEKYYQEHALPNKKTASDDLGNFNLYLANNTEGLNLAAKKLSQIGRSEISALFNKISKNHKTTANRVLALVSSIFGKAIEWGDWEKENPCKGIKKNREVSRERFLQSDELPRFFEALAAEPNRTLRDFVLISLFTGARKGNVVSMRWEQISFERTEWAIPETKNGTPHTVPLIDELISILLERKEITKNSDWVFPAQSKAGHLQEPKKAWAKLLERAQIADLHIHDLRRTLGSWQASTGANLSVIGRSLNHKSVQTTAIYARINIDPIRQSITKASEAILANIPPLQIESA